MGFERPVKTLGVSIHPGIHQGIVPRKMRQVKGGSTCRYKAYKPVR
jgi:hypothetical protein